jgi:hypothetical protein
MTAAAELRAELKRALMDGAPHAATGMEWCRALDVVIKAHVKEASDLGPTEKWLKAQYPQVTDVPREIRIRWDQVDQCFDATAYRNGACYGNPFGYGATIPEACAGTMNRLMGDTP